MKKILIEIKNGALLQSITEEPMEIIIVDYDRQDVTELPVHIYDPDIILNGNDTFSDYFSTEYSNEAEVRKYLKRLKL